MSRFALAFLAVSLSACLVGRHDPPSSVYQTIPQARPYVEVGTVRASVAGYGLLGADARSAAIERLAFRRALYGADAVVGVRTRGGCPGIGWFALMFLAPNCYASASGIGVRWLDGPSMDADATIRMTIDVR